jgi:capsular exopolysaccharide synthesis family protein
VTQLLAASTQVESVISDLNDRIDRLGDDDPERAALESQRATFAATLDQLRVDAALQTGGAVVIKPASIPESPAGPTPLRNTALAALAGLLIGLIAAFVLERLDDTVRSAGQLEALTDQPLLGKIPVDPPADQGPLALTAYGRSSVEAYRDLRTSMGALVGDEPLGTIQITSALSGEGKTAAATNLAVVLAQAGHRVALVDADLRRPQVHDSFGIPVGPGVTDLIRGAQPKDVVQHIDVGSGERLSVFTSGAVPPNPSEILSGRRMRKLLTRLGEHYEYVVIDSVPVLPVTDSVALAAVVDEVIVVALAGSVRAAEVEETIRRLDRVEANVVGFVLNQAPMLPSSIEDYGPDPRPTTAEDLEADATSTSDDEPVDAVDGSDETSGDHSDARDDAVAVGDAEPGERPVAGDDDADVLLADA